MRRDANHVTERIIHVEGQRSRERPKKRCIDCVKEDMRVEAVDCTLTADTNEWKKTCCADFTYN